MVFPMLHLEIPRLLSECPLCNKTHTKKLCYLCCSLAQGGKKNPTKTSKMSKPKNPNSVYFLTKFIIYKETYEGEAALG